MIVALVGMVEQRELPAGDHVAGGLVAADEDEQRLLHDRLVVEPLAVDLGVAQQADEVGLLRLRAPVGDHVELQRAEAEAGLHRRRRRSRASGSDVVARMRSSDQRSRSSYALGLEPEHVGDEQQRERRGDVPHEVALTPLAHLVDDLVADGADARPRARPPAWA